jgi:hypothetical protein
MVAGGFLQWYVQQIAGEIPPGIDTEANLAVFAIVGELGARQRRGASEGGWLWMVV